jgi:hypothetical protein
MAAPFRFSVIIPLEFHRGHVQACLRRWTREQTYAPERYEVVTAGCRSSMDAGARREVERELRAQDRLLLFDEPHDVVLCARAAAEARGDVLFFTESHCLPEADALERADDTLRDRPEWSGFSGRSIPITHNRLSVAEAELYDADIRYGMEEHPWRKILDQFFVVRNERYQDAGGFRPELGHFAEWHLAARMHWKGYCIGYAPALRLHHYYIGDTRELVVFSSDFARGELTFHSNFVDDDCRSYFPAPPEWAIRHQWSRRFARGAFRLSLRRRSRRSLIWAARACFGSGPRVLAAALRFQAALWALRISVIKRAAGPSLRGVLVELIEAAVELERIRFVRRWLAWAGQSGTTAASAGEWRPDTAHTFWSIGFHLPEQSNGRCFTWCQPLTMIELALVPGRYRLTVEWLTIKGTEDVRVYVNEKDVGISASESGASGHFEVATDRPVRLALTSRPIHADGDSRLLGLPITAISWRRA